MRPLILNYAVKREGICSTIYEYDFEQSLNVVTTKNGKKPFIDVGHNDLSLLTKTKVINESDDTGYNILELGTLTEVSREESNYNILLELKTKTFTNQERDDEGINYFQ